MTSGLLWSHLVDLMVVRLGENPLLYVNIASSKVHWWDLFFANNFLHEDGGTHEM